MPRFAPTPRRLVSQPNVAPLADEEPRFRPARLRRYALIGLAVWALTPRSAFAQTNSPP
jgi:hypothetical protein